MTGDIGESMIVRFEGKSRVEGNTSSIDGDDYNAHCHFYTIFCQTI